MQSVFMFLEKSFTAATFAEAGFHSTARNIAKLSQPADGWVEDHMVSAAMSEGDWASRIEQEKPTTVFDMMDNLFVPMAFAEAGHLDIAQELMGKKQHEIEPIDEFISFIETVGLRQDQVRYGLVTI